jgi:glycine/D-amino acid oxidase-like deaminating enzyme
MITHRVDAAVLGCGIVGSYLAARLLDRGVSVAVVDRARAPGQRPAAPHPRVVATPRPHAGIVDARHHEPGGNSAYWGGAMLRIPDRDVAGVLDSDAIDATALADAYQRVERAFDFPHTPSRHADPGLDATLAEALFLPAAAKHVYASRLARRLDRAQPLFDSEIVSLDCRGGTLRAIGLRRAGGDEARVEARRWIVCMGVVDTLLFAQRHASALFATPPSALGRYLHDHVSVPLYRVNPRPGGDFLARFPPRFHSGFLSVPRFEFAHAGTWDPRAFVHCVFDFDAVSPYTDLKRVLALRQARAGAPALVREALSLLPHAPGIARIGLGKLFAGRLHVPASVPVSALLDFETVPSADNRLDHDPGSFDAATLHWDLRAEDEEAYAALVERAGRILGALGARHGFERTPLCSADDRATRIRYLHAAGKDILHLGGGLAPARRDARSVLAPDFSFPAACNAYVISTAVFARPGVVNPTHTLLALAEWLLPRL